MRRASMLLSSVALMLLTAQTVTAQQPLALGELPPPGKAALLVATSPVHVFDILNELANRSCHVESLAVIESGEWHVFIQGAPAAVNAAFPSLKAQQPFYVRCGPNSVTPAPGGVLDEITLDPGPRCIVTDTGATITVDDERVTFGCHTIPGGASIVLLGTPTAEGLSLTATKAFIFPESDGWRLAGSTTETVRIEEVTLSDGTRCAFAGEGTTLAFEGQRVNYTCGTGDPAGDIVLLGDFEMTSGPAGFVLAATRGVVVSGGNGFELASSSPTTVSAITSSSVQGQVTATVTGPPSTPLPPHSGARVTAELVDVSLPDVAAPVLATQTIVGDGGPHGPWEFVLTYDPDKIVPTGRYAVHVRVEVGGELVFTTDEAHLVITAGNPTELDITLRVAPGALGSAP